MDRLPHPKTEVATSRLDTETRTKLTAALTALALPFSACHTLPSAETTPETVTVTVTVDPPPERPAFNPDKPTDVSVTRVRTPEEATASLLSRDAIESKITTLSDAITNELPVEPFSLDSVDDVVLKATGTKEDTTTPCYKKSDLNKTLRSQIDRNTAAHNPEIANSLTMLQLSAATPLCDVGGFA